MIPSPGRIVMYRLTVEDAVHVNRRRADAETKLEWHRENKTGAVVHCGNRANAGDVYPMIISRVWDDPPQPHSVVQGQVFLDGNDTLWKTSVMQQGETLDPEQTEGVWFQPPTV